MHEISKNFFFKKEIRSGGLLIAAVPYLKNKKRKAKIENSALNFLSLVDSSPTPRAPSRHAVNRRLSSDPPTLSLSLHPRHYLVKAASASFSFSFSSSLAPVPTPQNLLPL